MAQPKRELFSQRVQAGSRTYFFDVRESVEGTKYLVISEARRTGDSPSKHNRVMVFGEHARPFYEGLKRAIRFVARKNARKSSYVEEARREFPRAYTSWTEDEDSRLADAYAQGKTINELAHTFQRKPGAIASRLRKLALGNGQE
jgi:hypothetical protein